MWIRPRGSRALAEGLTACRKAKSMTQAELAGRLRVNRSTVIDMEAGRNPVLTRYADALAMLGYDLVLVPRGAAIAVQEPAVAMSAEAELRVGAPR
jgi:transcriptional regulator with XRE-family HTH domain